MVHTVFLDQLILFWLGLCPRSHWGSLQRSPNPLAEFKGPTSKRREGKWRKGKERGREGNGRDGKKCSVPPPTFV